jgi:hypothetical protein
MAISNHRFYVVHMVKHAQSQFVQSPTEEAATQRAINAFILSWSPKVEQVTAFHCMGLSGDWDWIGIFGMNDLADWVAFREDLIRSQNHHIEKFVSMPAISHEAFRTATASVAHYQALHADGVLPGQAELQR